MPHAVRTASSLGVLLAVAAGLSAGAREPVAVPTADETASQTDPGASSAYGPFALPGADRVHGPFALDAVPGGPSAPVTGGDIAGLAGFGTAGNPGVPASVLDAYRRAETTVAADQPACRLPWWLLAGIGKVESGHASGGRVDATGTTVTPIRGPQLDGGPGVAAIRDTDQGRWDGDTVWDRAVGPMQFIPGTWRGYAADGNADGVASPHNVHDAAVAAGRYLCAGGGNLSDPAGQRAALMRYNRSTAYGTLVLRWAAAYAAGVNEIGGVTGPPVLAAGPGAPVPIPPVVLPPAGPVPPGPAPETPGAPAPQVPPPGGSEGGIDPIIPTTTPPPVIPPVTTAPTPTPTPTPTVPPTPTIRPTPTPSPTTSPRPSTTTAQPTPTATTTTPRPSPTSTTTTAPGGAAGSGDGPATSTTPG